MWQRMLKRLKRQDGFTLMELIVVVAILGILAAILTPRFLATLNDSRVKALVSTGKQIQLAMERYNMDNGSYPPATGTTPVPVSSYDTLRPYIDPYMNLPTTGTFTVQSYNLTGGYTLVIRGNNTTRDVTITPAAVTAAP